MACHAVFTGHRKRPALSRADDREFTRRRVACRWFYPPELPWCTGHYPQKQFEPARIDVSLFHRKAQCAAWFRPVPAILEAALPLIRAKFRHGFLDSLPIKVGQAEFLHAR